MTARDESGPRKRRVPVKLKRARRRKASSTRWLERQLNDPYVRAAREAGYRSRAAYKLIGLAENADILKPGQRVVDLGAAPGGWSQVAAERVGKQGRVVAVDTTEIEPIDGVTILTIDACGADALEEIRAALDGPADLVMSDMAAPTTGHASTDRLRVSALCETALDIAEPLLAPGGCFLAKLRQGGRRRASGPAAAGLRAGCATPSRRQAVPIPPRATCSPPATAAGSRTPANTPWAARRYRCPAARPW